MNKQIEKIVQELLAMDQGFAEHEQEIRTLVEELLRAKPDTRLDEQFVVRLRERLIAQKPEVSPFSRFAYAPYVLGILAILLVVPIGIKFMTQGTDSSTAVFAMNQQIEKLPQGAYGTLQTQEGGRGGGDLASMASNYAVGADTRDARMMLPQGEVTVYTYKYTGEPLTLSEPDGLVYSRIKNQQSSGQIATQLKKLNFGLINLNAYSDLRVRSFELVEDKPYGYSVNVNFDEGQIGINPDYTRWPNLNGKEAQEQIPMSAVPPKDEVIAVAEKFIKDHGISLENYDAPTVQEYAHMGIADTQMQYAPEQITVTFPLKIAGTAVYEDGAYPYGIQIGVGVKDKRVMSMYGLSSQTYSSSEYALETDTQKILTIVEKGGVNAWVPEETSETKIKQVEAEVGTPTKILMHTYSSSESKEVFVPALSFPVTKAPAGEQYYPRYIVVPLVPDLLVSQGPTLYDVLR